MDWFISDKNIKLFLVKKIFFGVAEFWVFGAFSKAFDLPGSARYNFFV